MATSIKDGKLLYHLTSLKNLEGILRKGLVPRSMLDNFVDVADTEIIEQRKRLSINDYVPFHFFARNPFDGSVQKSHPDEQFVYITIARTTARTLKFQILPKHPLAMDQLVIYDFDTGMASIDWNMMDRRDYRDRNCKLVCLAECIYKGILKSEHFHSIVAPTSKVRKQIGVLSSKILGRYTYHINENQFWFIY
jgi:hypothetical protein